MLSKKATLNIDVILSRYFFLASIMHAYIYILLILIGTKNVHVSHFVPIVGILLGNKMSRKN